MKRGRKSNLTMKLKLIAEDETMNFDSWISSCFCKKLFCGPLWSITVFSQVSFDKSLLHVESATRNFFIHIQIAFLTIGISLYLTLRYCATLRYFAEHLRFNSKWPSQVNFISTSDTLKKSNNSPKSTNMLLIQGYCCCIIYKYAKLKNDDEWVLMRDQLLNSKSYFF